MKFEDPSWKIDTCIVQSKDLYRELMFLNDCIKLYKFFENTCSEVL